MQDVQRGANGGEPGQPCGPRVWAVGGGKGGVGKSVVASNLAVSLANRGHRTVIIDADLGGANLHTVLGAPTPVWTLSHFFKSEIATLDEARTRTLIPNLTLISGSRALLDMANLSHARKQRFLRHLRKLHVDHVVLDLSAGSTFNALDFFLSADERIAVVVPEPTSVENACYFLKAAFFRWLRSAVRDSGARKPLQEMIEARAARRLGSPRELVEAVAAVDPEAGRALAESAGTFSAKLIVNQVRKDEHRSLGRKIQQSCQRYLGADLVPIGSLCFDEFVRDAVQDRVPLLRDHPGCRFATDFERVLERLLGTAEATPAEPDLSHRIGPALCDERYFSTHGAEPPLDEIELVAEAPGEPEIVLEVETDRPTFPAPRALREAGLLPSPVY